MRKIEGQPTTSTLRMPFWRRVSALKAPRTPIEAQRSATIDQKRLEGSGNSILRFWLACAPTPMA